MPDRKIIHQMNLKNPISYMSSEKSFLYQKTPSVTSSDKSQRTFGSVISTTDMVLSVLPRRKREENKSFAATDTDKNLFDTFPENHDVQDDIKNSTLGSVRDEVKTRESLALRDLDLREQWRQTLYAEERAFVQGRIQELMKKVGIRKDFRPPKPERDFVTENIHRLRNIQPTKRSHFEEKVKPRGKP
ncbi:uncharacterized protein LOC108029328 [Drosophila biarmipes]|uniref:uncharacterized protein LOC108029328 n=1 Tax=Drosophila biarmipes TaxID=125945 RepID=UPI0021CCC5AD|nr:uncharacterized protein LOC108029328 [Drosophila biarmipes]